MILGKSLGFWRKGWKYQNFELCTFFSDKILPALNSNFKTRLWNETEYGAACHCRRSDFGEMIKKVKWRNSFIKCKPKNQTKGWPACLKHTLKERDHYSSIWRCPLVLFQSMFIVQHNPWKHFWKHCVSCVWADICFDGVCPKFAISPQRRMEDERIMKNPPEKKTQSNSFRG